MRTATFPATVLLVLSILLSTPAIAPAVEVLGGAIRVAADSSGQPDHPHLEGEVSSTTTLSAQVWSIDCAHAPGYPYSWQGCAAQSAGEVLGNPVSAGISPTCDEVAGVWTIPGAAAGGTCGAPVAYQAGSAQGTAYILTQGAAGSFPSSSGVCWAAVFEAGAGTPTPAGCLVVTPNPTGACAEAEAINYPAQPVGSAQSCLDHAAKFADVCADLTPSAPALACAGARAAVGTTVCLFARYALNSPVAETPLVCLTP